jgi:5-methylcytosine-specific restriction protein A
LASFNPLGLPWGKRGKTKIPTRHAADGKRVCGWCAGEIPPRRSSWCSRDCANAAWLRMNWAEIRRYVVKRDKAACVICADKYSCLEVDHIVAVKDGGTDDPANLRLLCEPCHKKVTADQRRRWMAANKSLELSI